MKRICRFEIIIDKGSILHEIASRAYAHGEVSTQDERMRWLLQSVERQGKENMIRRAISDGMEMVALACSPYATRCEEVEALNIIVIDLTLPDNCMRNVETRMKRLVCGFLAENCVAVWKSIMQQPSDYELVQANKLIGDIRVLLNSRVGIQRQILE